MSNLPSRWIALVVLLSPAQAEIIDRIAVSVANQVITTSDLDRQIRVSAFLSGGKPDFSAAAKRTALEGMVDQKLIRRELETSRYPIPDAAEATPLLEKLKAEHFKSDEDFRKALETYGISEQDVRDELLWQRTFLFFVEDRFRPAVQVTDEDVRAYFDRVVAPVARAANPNATLDLEDFRDRIVQAITGERTNEEMDRWLKEARGRTDIVYHDEVLR